MLFYLLLSICGVEEVVFCRQRTTTWRARQYYFRHFLPKPRSRYIAVPSKLYYIVNIIGDDTSAYFCCVLSFVLAIFLKLPLVSNLHPFPIDCRIHTPIINAISPPLGCLLLWWWFDHRFIITTRSPVDNSWYFRGTVAVSHPLLPATTSPRHISRILLPDRPQGANTRHPSHHYP